MKYLSLIARCEEANKARKLHLTNHNVQWWESSDVIVINSIALSRFVRFFFHTPHLLFFSFFSGRIETRVLHLCLWVRLKFKAKHVFELLFVAYNTWILNRPMWAHEPSGPNSRFYFFFFKLLIACLKLKRSSLLIMQLLNRENSIIYRNCIYSIH